MGDYFKGWRRKVGCVLLLISLITLAAWMRSQFASDTYVLRLAHRKQLAVSSRSGQFRISSLIYVDGGAMELWSRYFNYLSVASSTAMLSALLILWPQRNRPTTRPPQS